MIASTVMPVGCEGSSGPSPRSDASAGRARHNVKSNNENVRKRREIGRNFIRDGPLNPLYSMQTAGRWVRPCNPTGTPLRARGATLNNRPHPKLSDTRLSQKRKGEAGASPILLHRD